MRVLRYSRERGRAARRELGDEQEALEERLRRHLTDQHQITIEAVSREFLRGGKGEIAPQEKTLYYWRSLDRKPQERLWVIAHEYGHLVCHQRLTREATVPDPIHGSYLINHGTGEISRYSPRSREEAEANAFAAEFLAPANEVFQQWQDDAGLDSSLLAERLGVPVNLVRTQLAQALYDLTTEEDAEGKDTVWDVLCDEKQEEAAICVDKPLLVNAGPGTGKTKTLVRRIEHLVVDRKASPETLLALTFSNDAAEELRVRVGNKLGEDIAQQIEIATFHGFGRSFLDRHGHLQGLSVEAKLIDDAGQEELLSDVIGSVDCYRIVNLRNPGETVVEIARHIRYLKDRLVTPEAFVSHLAQWEIADSDSAIREEAEAFARVYSEYEVIKRNKQIIDFADLLALPIKTLNENPEVKTLTQDTYRWIMVDEYQDVSRAVAILLKEISRSDSPPWVVGDIRQAIYLFRGAAPENVLRFTEDFEGGINKLLRKNYRSAAPIISVANQLATLMNSPDHSTAEVDRYWEAGTSIQPIGNGFEGIITANCDTAERDAVAQQIKHWINGGVNPGNIAVLARRNIDVRNTVLELSKRGIRARASGVVTAEGAAGDLATASIFIDRPGSCIARVAFALGHERFKREELNELISELLERGVKNVQHQDNATGESSKRALSGLYNEIMRFAELAEAERFSGDAFTMMSIFLFDATGYMRRLLEAPEEAEKWLALTEVVAALSRAASYRFSHPKIRRWLSRIWFTDYFRRVLTAGEPSPLVPRGGDCVRVMTCHASKGLEFPCVIVSGQTMPLFRTSYRWLPSNLTPSTDEDDLAADALLFVGATRAQQALLVTYAETAGGTARSRPREVPPLLQRWLTIYSIPRTAWEIDGAAQIEVEMGAIWGGTLTKALPVRHLRSDRCQLRTYLEEYIGLRYPQRREPLYPFFIESLRQAIQGIIRLANASGRRSTPQEAEAIFNEAWQTDRYGDHQLHALYKHIAQVFTQRFGAAYTPPKERQEQLNLVIYLGDGQEDSSEPEHWDLPIKLALLAHLRDGRGQGTAIALAPESLKEKKSKKGGVNWSSLNETHRISFALLRRDDPTIRPLIFSATDGVIYDYLWSQKPSSMDKLAGEAASRHCSYNERRFRETLNTWKCDRCPVRISCPYWIRALA